MSSNDQNPHQLIQDQGQNQPQRQRGHIIPRQVLVDLDPHKMSLEPLKLSQNGPSSRIDMDWRGGGGNQANNLFRGANLQYQRPTNNGKNNNGQKQEPFGPITLFKESIVSFENEFKHDGKNGGDSSKAQPLVGIQPPFYFMQNNGINAPKKKDSSKNKRSWNKSQGKDGEIGLTDLMWDLPTADVFKTLLFDQFKTPGELHDVLMEQLRIMVDKAKMDAETLPLRTYNVLQAGQVTEIFYWCKTLKVTTEMFFRSLELFDRFVVMFSQEIGPTLGGLGPEEKAVCMSRIVIQKPLRICCCIMLASKLHSNLTYPTIGLENIRAVLAKESTKEFSKKAISESEVRVLRILQYRTHWVTPYDLTEQLVSLLDIPLDSLPQIFTVAMLYLKYSYARHKDLYNQIRNIGQANQDPTRFKRTIEYNSQLRAAAVVAAAAYHVSEPFQKSCITKLSSLISEPDHRIEIFAHLLMDLVREVHPRDNIPKIKL